MESLIDRTLEGAERVSDIVQELKRFSGGQKEQVGEFDLAQTVRKAVEWVARASRIKPKVIYRMPDEFVYWGCKGQVHQIIVNLTQNALDAMSHQEEPLLEISLLEMDDGRVVIETADHGPGIPEQDLVRIFDPFFTSKPVGLGTGLGLYISYGMAREMGGDLTVENRVGGGARFKLSLPTHGEARHGH